MPASTATADTSGREVDVPSADRLPTDYVFLAKGDTYKTLNARRLTHASSLTVYIVTDARGRRTGLGVPRHILARVDTLAGETAGARAEATRRRDARITAQATAELRAAFPHMPAADVEQCVARAWRKGAGNVGRTGAVQLERKARLAVGAHVRHTCTEYDDLLRDGVGRDEARRLVGDKVASVLAQWRGGDARQLGRPEHTTDQSKRKGSNKRRPRRRRTSDRTS